MRGSGPTSGTAKLDRHERPVPEGRELRRRHLFSRAAARRSRSKTSTSATVSSRHLFRMAEDDIKVDPLRTGLKKDAAKVSASMATALLVYSGISLKMLVDRAPRRGAAHDVHGRVRAERERASARSPARGGVLHHRTAKSRRGPTTSKYLMKPGDFLWAGVGCTHAFYNQQQHDRALARDAVAAAAGAATRIGLLATGSTLPSN